MCVPTPLTLGWLAIQEVFTGPMKPEPHGPGTTDSVRGG